jgi:hypothetical protein
MKTVDRVKKRDQIVFSPKLVLLDQALSKQDPANLLENEHKSLQIIWKIKAPLSRQLLIMVKDQAFLFPNLLHSQLVRLKVIKMVELHSLLI